MNIAEIEKLVSLLRDAKISELAVSVDGAKVSLRKPMVAAVSSQPPAVRNQETEVRSPEPAVSPSTGSRQVSLQSAVYITAPMVGILHRLDTLKVGVSVKTGQVVAAIESMKLMNDVVSEHEGVIAEILVEDGMPVEYGHNLFRLK